MINNARRQHRGNRRPGRMARDSSALGTLSLRLLRSVFARFSAFVSVSCQPSLLPCRIPFPRNSLGRRRVHKWTSTGTICHAQTRSPVVGPYATEFTTRRGQRTETGRRTDDNRNPMCATESAGLVAGRRVFCDGWLFAGTETAKNTRRVFIPNAGRRRVKKKN